MKGSGRGRGRHFGAAGDEFAEDILAGTEATLQPLVPYLDTLRLVFIAVAITGIGLEAHARFDDWKRGRR